VHEKGFVKDIVLLLDQCGAGLFLETRVEQEISLGLAALEIAKPDEPAGDELALILQSMRGN
jgi:hypothetical protein